MSAVKELREAIMVIIHETNDIEHNVGSQIEEVDRITQLLSVVSEGSGSDRLEEMSRILQECRHSLNDAVSKLNAVTEKGQEYISGL